MIKLNATTIQKDEFALQINNFIQETNKTLCLEKICIKISDTIRIFIGQRNTIERISFPQDQYDLDVVPNRGIVPANKNYVIANQIDKKYVCVVCGEIISSKKAIHSVMCRCMLL